MKKKRLLASLSVIILMAACTRNATFDTRVTFSGSVAGGRTEVESGVLVPDGPLAGARVSCAGYPESVVTGPDGTYRFSVRAVRVFSDPGHDLYTLTASAPDGSSADVSVAGRPGDHLNVPAILVSLQGGR